MFVWKRTHMTALVQLEKVQSIAGAYAATLKEIGTLLIAAGADPKMGIVDALKSQLEEPAEVEDDA